MPSIAFDRAADYYDDTRGFADGVAERIRDAILAYTHTTPQSRFLEMGIGTGRIALPFIQAGYDYTGIDLSTQMVDRLRAKLAAEPGQSRDNYQLLQGDVTALPFADDSFDVVLEVHVLHLVDGWERAVAEAARVVRKPGGYFVSGFDYIPDSEEATSATASVNSQWDTILSELGYKREMLLPGIRTSKDDDSLQKFENLLADTGATVETIVLVEHSTPPLSPRQMAERHRQRMYSADWLIPDDIHAEAVRRMDAWLDSEVADPNSARRANAQFKAQIAHWR